MASTAVDSYKLNRGVEESERLDVQHEYYIKTLGYLFQPSIKKILPPNPRIADVATGTAAFLRHAAKDFPNAQLDGFDISTTQFPTDLPANISLHGHNAKEPFPAEFHGKYDVVHLRLLITAMDPQDWEVVTRNVLELLKPGGAIQWEDSNFSQVLPVLQEAPGVKTEALEKVMGFGLEVVSLTRLTWPLGTLQNVFKGLGMVDVVHDCFSSDRFVETRETSTNLAMGACYGAAQAFNLLPVEELAKLKQACEYESKNGAYVRWDIHCTTGFKPS